MPSVNVVPITGGAVEACGLAVPKHFKAAQRSAWNDLLTAVDPKLVVRANLFTFEIAATLLAKFRSGKGMTATESKELKKHMVQLGLAQDDDDGARKKPPRSNDKYFEP